MSLQFEKLWPQKVCPLPNIGPAFTSHRSATSSNVTPGPPARLGMARRGRTPTPRHPAPTLCLEAATTRHAQPRSLCRSWWLQRGRWKCWLLVKGLSWWLDCWLLIVSCWSTSWLDCLLQYIPAAKIMKILAIELPHFFLEPQWCWDFQWWPVMV